MTGPNKLERYVTLGWKGMPVTHALAYLAHSLVMKKSVFNLTLGAVFITLDFL
jgi:hypothetical protein